MRHEKIFKNNNEGRLKIVCSVYLEFHRSVKWNVTIYICKKGKRTWKDIIDTDNYSFRALSIEDRQKFIKQKNIEIAGIDRINETMLELWQMMKPKELK